MPSTPLTIVTLRRLLLVGSLALIALLAASFVRTERADAAPGIAPLVSNSVTSNYQGWAYVHVRSSRDTCGTVGPCGRQAWRWNGATWTGTFIGWETQVYVYPYSAPWSWVWTQRTGWLAIRTSDLQLRLPQANRCEPAYRCVALT